MKRIKFLSILLTAMLFFGFSEAISAQKTEKATPAKPAKVSPVKKKNSVDDCVAATDAQVKTLEKLCDEMRFVSTQDAKAELVLQKRVEKAKKIVKGDAITICKLYEKVKKSKKLCGEEKEMIKQFTALYEM
jgi:uncharacterized protein YlxW (UPF0749 family)